MEESSLSGIRGIGGLRGVRSPEFLQVKGLWYLTDTNRLGELFKSYELDQIIDYRGPVTADSRLKGIRQNVPVRIRSLDTNVDEVTAEVQITASLYGLTANDFVLQAGLPRLRSTRLEWSFV